MDILYYLFPTLIALAAVVLLGTMIRQICATYNTAFFFSLSFAAALFASVGITLLVVSRFFPSFEQLIISWGLDLSRTDNQLVLWGMAILGSLATFVGNRIKINNTGICLLFTFLQIGAVAGLNALILLYLAKRIIRK